MPRLPGDSFNQKTGEVFLQDYDRGVITTLGGVIDSKETMYILKNIQGVEAPPDYEGVPVYFAYSDEGIDTKILPSIIIRRDSITPSMSRWHLGATEYNVPAAGAHPITVTNPRTGAVIAQGWDMYERKSQAVPYDLLYTIEIRSRFRNSMKVESLKMLRFVMKQYQPYTHVWIKDSLDEFRSYNAFMETPAAVDIMPDIAGREANFNVTLRVEGELDLNDPENTRVLTQLPIFQTSIKKID